MPYNDEGWVYDFRTNGGHVDEKKINVITTQETVDVVKRKLEEATENITGPIFSRIEKHEHIVLENGEDFNVEKTPDYACSDCGNSEKDSFNTITHVTLDGTDYELECSKCESREIEESPALALHRMSEKLENYRNAWSQLKETLKHDAEFGQGHKVKRALFLMEEFEKTIKLD